MKSAEEFFKDKALKDGFEDEYNGDHFNFWLDCKRFDLQKDTLLKWVEEYASKALAELKAENEELKRQADHFKDFARWAIINAVMPFDKKNEFIYIESGKAFKDVDELFAFWNETINK
jgi:hypothetical protein